METAVSWYISDVATLAISWVGLWAVEREIPAVPNTTVKRGYDIHRHVGTWTPIGSLFLSVSVSL